MKKLSGICLVGLFCCCNSIAGAQAGTFQALGPDLVITDFSITSVTPHEARSTYTITNIGNKAAPIDNVTIQATYYLTVGDAATNTGKAGCGLVIGSVTHNLAPGQSISGTFLCTGNFIKYRLCTLRVDVFNKVAESKENNNS